MNAPRIFERDFTVGRRIVASIVTILAALLVTPAVGAEPRFETGAESIRRLDPATSDILWEARHASVWETSGRENLQHEITEPAVRDGSIWYGVGAWLVEADLDTGVVLDRTLFPGKIRSVELEGDLGILLLEIEESLEGYADGTEEAVVEFRHRPGAGPPRDLWEPMEVFGAWRDVAVIHPAVWYDDEEADADARHAALDLLEARRERDPGNAFFDYFIGRLNRSLGHADRADAAFAAAAANTEMSGLSDVQLAFFFDSVDEVERADVVFERGLAKLREGRPGMADHRSIVHHTILFGVISSRALESAVKARDFDTVHRLSTRSHRLAPHVESRAEVSAQLADWFAENGREDLAEIWRENARESEDTITAHLYAAPYFDLALLLLLAVVLGSWLAAFLFGLRSPRPEGGGLPRPHALEVGVLIVLFFTTPLLTVSMMTSLKVVGTTAPAPLEVLNESWAAQDARQWLSTLRESDARDTLIAHGEDVMAAYRAGEPPPAPLEAAPELLVEAVYVDSVVESLTSFGVSDAREVGLALPRLDVTLISAFVPLILAFLAGAFVSGRSRELALALTRFLPGGPRPFGSLTPLLTVALFAAVGEILGADTMLQSLVRIDSASYFGLEGISAYEPSEGGWGWWVLLAVVVVHVAGVWWDRGSEGRS